MKLIAILGTLFLSFNLLAQKEPIKFGSVPDDDLKMIIYPADSSASAVVLADYGESTIVYSQNNGFQIQFDRLRRIKILKKEGYDWANFVIALYKKDNVDEKLIGLKAITTNLEGTKQVETKLGKDGIFKEEASENWDHIKLTLPNVKEGSVIDITYKITSPYLFNFQDWEFQTTIPVRWSEYIGRIPEYFEYQKFMQGYVSLKVNDKGSERKIIKIDSKERTGAAITKTTFNTENIEYSENFFRWVAADVPALKIEPFMTSHSDYLSKINFELALIKMPNQQVKTVMGTWENINKELLDAKEFGGVIERSNFLNKIVTDITNGKESTNDKVATIFQYVKNNVEWDGNYRKYTDGNFKRVLDNKKGNSAEINLMLVSMLQKAGVEADPLVISTRNHGFVRQQFPASSQFNYVICAAKLNDKLILLDATDRTLPLMMIPERCLNGTGLLISKNNSRWIELTTPVKTRTVIEATLGFEEEGTLKGQVKLLKEGYDGQKMRIDFHSDGEEAYVKNFMDRNGWSIHSSKFENIKELDDPISETYEMSFANESNNSADILYVHPLIGHAIRENPFKSQTRVYPVDFGSAFEKTSLIKLRVPKGYEVDELPKALAISLPENGGRFIYSISNLNGVISLTSLMAINKGTFTQIEYPTLREFYSQVIAKQSELIVFKKVE